MIATATSDIALLIGSLLTGIAAVIAAIRSTQTHSEVKTMNAKTLGVLAGEQETRRIVEKPLDERTREDQIHLLDVPPEPSTPSKPTPG